jgi:RNA polymerase sigma-B factor
MSAVLADTGQVSVARFRDYRRTGDRAIRNEIVEEYAPLAYGCARRFANRGEPIDDLRQVALLGVLKAVERFDPERGLPFAAFAVPTVLGELRRHFRDKGWMMRVPRRLQELHLRIDDVVTALAQKLGRPPTPKEVAEAADVSEEQILEAMEAGYCYRPSSIDAAAPGTEPVASTLGETDRRLRSVEDRATLAHLLQRLSPRERRVVYLRYFEDCTQSEIAKEIGVSQMHVSRLLSRSLATLGSSED